MMPPTLDSQHSRAGCIDGAADLTVIASVAIEHVDRLLWVFVCDNRSRYPPLVGKCGEGQHCQAELSQQRGGACQQRALSRCLRHRAPAAARATECAVLPRRESSAHPRAGNEQACGSWADRDLQDTAMTTVPTGMPDSLTTERCPPRTEYIPESNSVRRHDPGFRIGKLQVADTRVVIEAH